MRRKLLNSLLVNAFFFLLMAFVFAQGEEKPIICGKVLDKFVLPSAQHPATAYLIVLDDAEGKAWSCKIERPKRVKNLEAYKKEEKICIYGTFIDMLTRQIKVKGIKRQSGEWDKNLSFAQDTSEIIPLESQKGRVFEMSVADKKRLILHTDKGENYILETKLHKELLGQLQEVAQKNWEVEINGIFKGQLELTTVDFKYADEAPLQQGKRVKNEGKKAILKLVDVVLIRSINKDVAPQKPPLLFAAFPVPADFQKQYSSPINLRKINGRVGKCNFKSVVPTLELEGKPNFIIAIPQNAQVVKVVGENLTAFNPKDVIKEGTELEIWYEEKGYLKNARIITIQEKDIANK